MSKLSHSALLALLTPYARTDVMVGAISRDHRGGLMGPSVLQTSFGNLSRPQFQMAQQPRQAPIPFYGQQQTMQQSPPPPQAYQNDPYANTLRNTGDTRDRYHYLPVNSNGPVAAGASSPCSTQPQSLAFRPARILVPASIAPDFTVDSIFCGIKPQFVASGAISAETFTQDARGCDMIMDIVTTSQNFTINVTNQSGAARQFRATVFGDSADT